MIILEGSGVVHDTIDSTNAEERTMALRMKEERNGCVQLSLSGAVMYLT